jgi:ferrous iron transport protein B
MATGAGCHGAPERGRDTTRNGAATITVALLGAPNTGKSTLYNRLTGGNAQIANWPGLTVELLRGRLPPGPEGHPRQLVDLPGIHDLEGHSADEALVQQFLRLTPPDVVLLVINASQIASQLRLVLQLLELGLPALLALNMSDEARRLGVRIDSDALGHALGIPVVAISAKRGEGIDRLLQGLTLARAASRGTKSVSAPSPDPDREGDTLLRRCVSLPPRPVHRRTRRIDRLLLHPLAGLLAFLGIVLGLFQLLYALAAPLQALLGALLDTVQTGLLEPALWGLGAPDLLRGFLINGVWMGVGTVATFLPLIFLFYLVMAVVEDSGYLPRAAFLMDGFMHWLGLDGRAFVLQVMGFGCNVPSIIGTRVIRDPSQRLLTMLVIPFALCQARLTVFVFMAGAFFPRPWWAPGLVVFGFYLLSFVAAIITGLVFKRVFPSREAFVLELPPYRSPSLATILRRAWAQMLSFMATTRVFIVVGAAAIWLLTNLPPGAAEGSGTSLAGAIGQLFQPLLGPIGMNPSLTVTLFFGFIAKEILLGAMAVIYRSSETALGSVLSAAITPLQALSFMTFVLLYTPCLGTIAAQLQEARSRRFALVSLGWSLSLAWLMALLVFQGGQLLGRLA